MKYAVLFLLAFLSSAHAGSVTISVQPGNLTKTFIVPDAHVARLLAVMKARYGQIASGPADPVTGIVPMRDRTNPEVFLAWVTGFMQGTIDAVTSDENSAAKAAVTVAPITAN